MKNLLVLAVVISLCGASLAQTKPTKSAYPEARKLFDQFEKTMHDSLTWEKRKPTDRAALLKTAIAQRDRTIKIWGDFSPCSSAASAHVNYVMELNKIASVGEGVGRISPFESLAAMSGAAQFGTHLGSCYDAVEALDQAVKP